MFDPETQFCGRCQHIALVKVSNEEKVNAAPLPEFLARRLSTNTAIRCNNCNQFIMSRERSCRHCGTYVRLEESAQAVETEKFLNETFDRVNGCKSASGLSLDFFKFHFWFFPLLILTPITSIASFILFLRTLWLGIRCWLRLSYLKELTDSRIEESYRDIKLALGKSAGAFLIMAVLGVTIAYSGAMALPMFWDNYAKGQREFNVGNFSKAESLFAKAISNNPNNLDAHIYYARSIWAQYVNDINADKQLNKSILDRSVTEFRDILQRTNDIKKKDEIYRELANIYKTIGNRTEHEQWLISRAHLSGQTIENQTDSYIKLATLYANDVTDLMQIYAVKERIERIYQPIKNWKPEDSNKLQDSARKAFSYLQEADLVDSKNSEINTLRINLYREFDKIGLKAEEKTGDKVIEFAF
jgi:tetratricopeptide (TPR) repeat protein